MIVARLPVRMAAVGATLALVGCGTTSGNGTGDSGSGSRAPSPAAAAQPAASTLTADMQRAVRSASSVHISGQLIERGETIGLNIGVLRSGQLSGTITQKGIPLKLIVTGGKAYVKATAAFLAELHVPASVCAVICGKFAELPAARTKQLTHSLSLASLTRPLTVRTPRFTSGGVATVNGQKADVLRTARGGIVDVAATGSHYPLAAASAGGRHGALTFSQWNSVPAPAAPPKSELVNVGNLG